MTQWNFQNKGKSGWSGTSSFVLEVSLSHLHSSKGPIGFLHDAVTWHKITHACEQVAQWYFQNKATRASPP